jgi:NTP pyrophosphatase (non-canonical NTP hydrolase)
LASEYSDRDLQHALYIIKQAFRERLREKGPNRVASYHELLGIITEEYTELISAVRQNRPLAIREELMDIAVACMLGIA